MLQHKFKLDQIVRVAKEHDEHGNPVEGVRGVVVGLTRKGPEYRGDYVVRLEENVAMPGSYSRNGVRKVYCTEDKLTLVPTIKAFAFKKGQSLTWHSTDTVTKTRGDRMPQFDMEKEV